MTTTPDERHPRTRKHAASGPEGDSTSPDGRPISTLLAGKSVVVTGAGRGLGRAYALACAAHGASVVVNDVDASAAYATRESIMRSGGLATAHIGSVARWDTAQELIELAAASGRLDGLVANAAVHHQSLPWLDTEDDITRIVGVNVIGGLFTGIHAMRAMLDRGGSIVTVTSGARFGIPKMSAYGVTKGAVSAMTAVWATEGRPYGIRVNAVSPLAHTRMSAADLRSDRPPLAAPERIAPLVVALLSDQSSDVTGQTFRFDGETLSAYEETRLATLSDKATLDELGNPSYLAARLRSFPRIAHE